MKIHDIEPQISVSVTGVYRDQTDMRMTVQLGNKVVAALDFSVYQGQPSIKYIKVDSDYRKRGLGKLMIRELQRMYPDQEIDWGYTTPEGTELYRSIKHREVPKPEVIKRLAYLQKLKKQLYKLDLKLRQLPQEQRAKFTNTVSDRWNRYHDIASKLEHELAYDSRTHKKIVDLNN